MAQSIAGYEASAEVTSFTSKFDAMRANKAQFTAQEQAGYDLFRGKAQCNACHRDGGPGEDPLFTDFTASNIGTPANPRLPFYTENRLDARGYVANPAWSSFVDGGVGAFLTKGHPLSQPSPIDTHAYANAGRRRRVPNCPPDWLSARSSHCRPPNPAFPTNPSPLSHAA